MYDSIRFCQGNIEILSSTFDVLPPAASDDDDDDADLEEDKFEGPYAKP